MPLRKRKQALKTKTNSDHDVHRSFSENPEQKKDGGEKERYDSV